MWRRCRSRSDYPPDWSRVTFSPGPMAILVVGQGKHLMATFDPVALRRRKDRPTIPEQTLNRFVVCTGNTAEALHGRGLRQSLRVDVLIRQSAGLARRKGSRLKRLMTCMAGNLTFPSRFCALRPVLVPR